jgi:hypothetical protein
LAYANSPKLRHELFRASGYIYQKAVTQAITCSNIFRYSENNFLARLYGGLTEKINTYFMKKTVKTDLC